MAYHLTGAAPGTVHLQLLGGFRLEVEGDCVRVAPTVQRLLAFVALHSRPVLRSFVAGSLWPDVSESRAVANLRATLWRIPDCGDLLDSTRAEVSLHPDVSVDFRTAVVTARSAIDGFARGGERPAEALSFDLLPGWVDEWVVVERDRLRQLRLHALESTCRVLLEGGAPALAIDVALGVADEEPLRESVQRILVQAHLAEGNQLEALRTYERYRDRVHAAMGLRPSPMMEEVIAPVCSAEIDPCSPAIVAVTV